MDGCEEEARHRAVLMYERETLALRKVEQNKNVQMDDGNKED